MKSDSFYMQRALSLAEKGQFTARPNPCVGCVIVRDDEIVGEGTHWRAGGAHAEKEALLQAKAKAKGATAYITLEPCVHEGRTAPCLPALVKKQLRRVVIANLDPNPRVNGQGVRALKEAGIAVEVGLLAAQARTLNQGFFSRMMRKRPYVRAKIAMSIDGRIATKTGASQWITSLASQKEGHLWRARSGAILTGSQTVKQDNCRLNVRHVDFALPPKVRFEPPWRVVVDSGLSVASDAAIFHQPGQPVIATVKSADGHWSRARSSKVTLIRLSEKAGRVDLAELLSWLAMYEVNDVLVEAGPTLVGALLKERLIDELLIYAAPTLLGHEGLAIAHLPGICSLKDRIMGRFNQAEHIGEDVRLNLKLSEFARA